MFYKFILSVIVLVFFSTLTFAQTTLDIEGMVTDSAYAAVAGANIFLVHGTDTLTTVADNDGHFLFAGIKKADLSLIIKHLGYKDYLYRLSPPNNQDKIDLGKISLKIGNTKLKEVVVKAKAQPVVFKQDTTEYDVASFN